MYVKLSDADGKDRKYQVRRADYEAAMTVATELVAKGEGHEPVSLGLPWGAHGVRADLLVSRPPHALTGLVDLT